VYRKTAAVLTVVLALAVLMPYVSLIAEADADLPACCRGDGEHKCAMRLAMAMARMAEPQGDVYQSIACRCPMQKPLSPVGRAAFYPAATATVHFESRSFPALLRQTAIARLVSRARSNLKRGPPFPTSNC